MSGSAPDKCLPAQNLFIAIPAYQGTISTETASSVIATVMALKAAGMAVQTQFHNGSCYIEIARNDLVAEFLASGYGDMIFVDADVSFHPATVLRMCLATRPFVAAIYPKKGDKLEFPIEFKPGERWSDAEGLIEVKMVPTGLLRLNRAVFEHVKARKYTNGLGRVQRAYFRNDVREYFYGEDVEFCRKWREAGGKVRIVADATMGHFGMKTWIANIGDAMKSGVV